MNPTVDDMTQQQQHTSNDTSNTDTDIINYIKRNIMVQIHQMHHHHHTMNPFLRTLQRHLHNIDDLVLTHFHFPFGTISLHSHLSHIIGGKGGFGTLLKGQSKQSSMNTTKNFTSCRNLQGQRLQHVNDTIHLQLVTEWKEKIQNGIATEYDMMKALTNTASGIPGWHLPLPSWSEVSIKKEMKQNQKLLHRYQREQQQQQQHKNTIQQQREQQLHHYIDTTQQWTERMEQTVSSALQRSLHKKHPLPPPLQTLKHDHKRPKVEMNSNTAEDTPVLTSTQPLSSSSSSSSTEPLPIIPPIVTISGTATISFLPLSFSSSTSVSNTSEMLYWNIQSDSNFCTIGVLLQQEQQLDDNPNRGSGYNNNYYYEVVLVTGTGDIQMGWAAMTTTTTVATISSTTTTTTAKDHHNQNDEDEPSSSLQQLFQPNSDNGDGVGDCQYSWGYDPTRHIKLHNGETEPYDSRDSNSDRKTSPPSNNVQPGDVIGCMYHSSTGEISYTYNGQELGISYNATSSTTDKSNLMTLIPAISLNEGEQIELRLQKQEMKYLPNTATAVGEILLKAKLLLPNASDYENTIDKIERSRNRNEDNENNQKPRAIEATETIKNNLINPDIPLVTDISPSNEATTPVIEKSDYEDPVAYEPIDLHQYQAASELEVLGLQRLKIELTKRGLKCGGTIQERATRLFAIRDITNPNEYPSKLLAPTKKNCL